MIGGLISMSLILLAQSANAEEMSQDQKMMEAAAIVLGGASQTIGGTVFVDKTGESASYRPIISLDYKISFAKVSDCVYKETWEVNGQSKYLNNSHVYKIDFSKLTGRWQEDGETIDFESPQPSHCFYMNKSENGCWPGRLHIMSNLNHQQMIDDVDYILRHGCDASVNNDPDPH